MKTIKEEFLEYIKDNNLIESGDGVVVGLSGGPDSVCLLNLLYSIKDIMNLKLAAVHINHMFRGEEADKDEKYAEKMCNDLGVEFFSHKVNVSSYAKEHNLSSETAGREVRYKIFEDTMKKLGYSKVATAHNANDQAETIIMRIMRGTGLEGLSGIPVKRDGIYIRPILFMTRDVIEQYCRNRNLEPRIDATNKERIYSRNKIRLDILPYMKENFNDDIVGAINRMVNLLKDDNDYINNQVEECYKKYTYRDNEAIVIKKVAFDCNASIINRIIRKAVKDVTKCNYDIELKHIDEVKQLASMETNKQIDLPNGAIAKNIYGNIYIYNRNNNMQSQIESEIILSKNDIVHKTVQYNKFLFDFEVINNEKNIKFTKNNSIKYFNYDGINGNIMIRKRKNGDKIIPFGMKGSKKLKNIFIDKKIPQGMRDEIPIIQIDDDIAWIVHVKESDKYKVTNDTKKILKITVRER